ncbi:MAG: tRNA uracil 4-sulfurtransferase ThiI [Filifactoraceae bacterium]
MYNTLIIRNGEIAIKGQNRSSFEKSLIKNIKRSLLGLEGYKVYKGDGRIYVDFNKELMDEIIRRLKSVFGVVSFSPAVKIEKGYDNLKESCYDLFNFVTSNETHDSFKVDIKRKDKAFPMSSPEMSRDIGGYILSKTENDIKVNVTNPDLLITGEFRPEGNIIYAEKIKGQGGLPIGINGKGLMLLSGGIDSPVAMYMAAKRGLKMDAVHFHSFPYTSERSKEKVISLGKIVSNFANDVRINMINLLPIQKEISEKCPAELSTIISRRFMMRIAEKIALDSECQCLFTGESIGQVASQTLEGLTATNSVVKEIPVLRPLISFDKEDIIAIANDIGTFDTSIIPEEDCCTVFLPKNPSTKPKMAKILSAEENLDVDNLVREALENIEVLEINTI